MMDIAEIRKKAKQQQGKPEQPVAEDIETLEADAQQPAETPQAVTATDAVATNATVVAAAAVEQKHHDALDRLFATTDDLVLATDESYAEFLETSAESAAKNVRQYLAFNLGDEEYALDIGQISEIIKLREFTDIPRAPLYVLGIISLRGVVVPVFDLRLRLNLGQSELLATSRIVVCQNEEMTVGLLVDNINQVVNLVEDEIEPPPGVLSGLDREMVSGIGRFQGRMIILLHIDSVLDVEMS